MARGIALSSVVDAVVWDRCLGIFYHCVEMWSHDVAIWSPPSHPSSVPRDDKFRIVVDGRGFGALVWTFFSRWFSAFKQSNTMTTIASW